MQPTYKPTKRLFAGIKIQPDTSFLMALDKMKNDLAKEDIRWTPHDKLHLTLLFFGEIPVAKTATIHISLQEIANSNKGFKVKLSSPGLFGSHYKPRVIWIGVIPQKNIIELHENIRNALNPHLSTTQQETFVPHITFGRIQSLYDKTRFHSVFNENKKCQYLQEISINSFSLFESILKPNGAIHKEVYLYTLKKA